jgi:hypothetical protein
VTVSCEYCDEPLGTGFTELVNDTNVDRHCQFPIASVP